MSGSAYAQFDQTMPTEVSGVMVIPHWKGTGTPEMAPGACGTITGLTAETTTGDIYRAILEGLCFEMRYNRDQLKECGIVFDSLSATGGGARSDVWLQMKADILQVPVTPLQTNDAGAAGGAMLAAVSQGVFANLADASADFVIHRDTFMPNQEYAEAYDEKYKKFKSIRQYMLEIQ